MSTTSVTSSKNERARSDLPMELEAARALNNCLRTHLKNMKMLKQTIIQINGHIKTLHKSSSDIAEWCLQYLNTHSNALTIEVCSDICERLVRSDISDGDCTVSCSKEN